MDYKIFCDMDGVLCDFNTQFIKFSDGIDPKIYEGMYGKDGFWDLINKIGVKFWAGMPWMSGGKKLWSYIEKYTPSLLSAPSYDDSSKIGKRLWVKNNLPGAKLILAPAIEKQEYASPNHILIDDFDRNIEQWVNKGGIGILYKNTNQTIRELKKLNL